MKYFFYLLLVLFFSFSTIAKACPPDSPLEDIQGACYSCDDTRTFIHISVEGEDFGNTSIQYKGGCKNLCPNRLSYSDGWLEGPEYCTLDTTENRLKAYLINNIMHIMFNPLNWLNCFIIWIILYCLLLWSFKRYSTSILKNIIKIFSVLLSIIFILVFLNNLIITFVGILFFIFIKFKKSKNS